MATPPPQRDNVYPIDIAWTRKSRHALASYQKRLRDEENELFVSENSRTGRFVILRDLIENESDFRAETKISSMPLLDTTLSDGALESPTCRFIFLHTANSRSKLCCSRDQLTRVLSHHEVMPAFLDFCFEFKNREKASTAAMFRFEDGLGKQLQGNRIQHAFNVMAPELDTHTFRAGSDTHAWRIRHTTAYHSFDFSKGKSVWIVIKGNRLMRDRITSTPAPTPQNCDTQFNYSLETHRHILEWCTENWSPYMDYLEERVRKHETAIKLAPVEDIAKRPPKSIMHRRRSNRRTTGVLRTQSMGSQHLGVRGRIRSGISRISSGLSGQRRMDSGLSEQTQTSEITAVPEEEDGDDLNEMFSFDALQSIRRVTDEVEEASMVIKENRRILTAIQDRYSNLARTCNDSTGAFAGVGSFELAILDFCQQLSVLQGDLESHETRLQLMLRGLERNEEMFQGILQYGNMRAGEHYAKSAEVSASTMQEWTERMHDIAAETEQETVSMHGITVITLIFLPGTFVSTLFSSGIWNFDNTQTANIGDWETRVPALKLFFAICIPMMVLSLSVWGATYWWAKHRHRVNSPDAEEKVEA